MLDVGCGPGTITIDLARRVAPGRVIGIDRAEEALGQARAAAVDAGVDTVTFEIGDVYALDLPDASVDVVHAHQVLQHLTDPVAALREMARVCRPGGVIAARDADYAAFTWWPADPRLDAWLDLYRACARDNHAEPDAGRRLLAWAHAAGLADTTASAGVWCYATPADRAWWGGMWADRIVQSALADQAVSQRPGQQGRPAGHAPGLARVGGRRRRLVPGSARRDPGPAPLIGAGHQLTRTDQWQLGPSPAVPCPVACSGAPSTTARPCPGCGGTSSDGLRSKKPNGLSQNDTASTAMIGHSSGLVMWWMPKTYQSTTSVDSSGSSSAIHLVSPSSVALCVGYVPAGHFSSSWCRVTHSV